MLNSIKTAITAVGTTCEGYLTLIQNHSISWQKSQAIEQAFSEKAHVASVAKKMQKLANELSAIDPAVIAETNTLVTEALTARGLK